MRILCSFGYWILPAFYLLFLLRWFGRTCRPALEAVPCIHEKIDRKAFENHVMGTEHIQDQHIKRGINQDSIFLILIKQSFSEKPYCSKINCWKDHITFSQTCPVVRTDIAGIILKQIMGQKLCCLRAEQINRERNRCNHTVDSATTFQFKTVKWSRNSAEM